MTPDHITAPHWDHAITIARQACARIFRDGGTPADALAAFGLSGEGYERTEWARCVELIAQTLCVRPMRKAA